MLERQRACFSFLAHSLSPRLRLDPTALARERRRATAPTPLKDGPNSGTSNPASTGWTGGTGGSHNGTTAAGPTPGSQQYQPPVAKGLDLKKSDPPKC